MTEANDQPPDSSSVAAFYATMADSLRVVEEAREARRKRLSISIPSKAAISIVLSCVVFAVPAALGLWFRQTGLSISIDAVPFAVFFFAVNALGIYNLISLYFYNTGVDETPTDIELGEDDYVASADEAAYFHIMMLVLSAVAAFALF